MNFNEIVKKLDQELTVIRASKALGTKSTKIAAANKTYQLEKYIPHNYQNSVLKVAKCSSVCNQKLYNTFAMCVANILQIIINKELVTK